MKTPLLLTALFLSVTAQAQQINVICGTNAPWCDAAAKTFSAKTGVAVNFAKRPLWLLRGVDRTGLNDFEVGH